MASKGRNPNARWLLNAAAMAALLVGLSIAGGASALAGTDMAVATPDISFSNSNPVDGDTITIFVGVWNFGDKNATNVTVLASVTSTSQFINGSDIPFLGAGSQAVTAISWKIVGEGNMSVSVSVSSSEVDANPSNNQATSANLFVRSRPDLKVDSVLFDNPTPPPGTGAVTIQVRVSNIGGSDATQVRVALYDGEPVPDTAIYTVTLAIVTLSTPQSFNYAWDITAQKGRHDIYAVVESSLPAEKTTNLANNWASGRLLVLTEFDIIVTPSNSPMTINFDPLKDGFVIVKDGGTLRIENTPFILLQERANQYDFIVEPGGSLTVWNSDIASAYTFGFSIFAGATVRIQSGSTIGGAINSLGGSLTIEDSTVSGDLTGSYSSLTLRDSALGGTFTLTSSTVTATNTTVSSTKTAVINNTRLTSWRLTLPTSSEVSLRLTGGSVASLAGIVSGPVGVEAGSTATIWREVDFQVSDFTGIPVSRATLDAQFSVNGSTVEHVVTNAEGMASAWLLSDILTASGPQYVGSYRLIANYSAANFYTTAVYYNLPFYPTLTADAAHLSIELVFEVIDPADLFKATLGDKTVDPGVVWIFSDFTQDGNLYVKGTMTLDGRFTLDQDYDFEKAVVCSGTGAINVRAGGQMVSSFRFNIYLYDSCTFTASGGVISLNALVTFNASQASIGSGSRLTGSLVLQGSSFTLDGSQGQGTRLHARPGSSVIIRDTSFDVTWVDVNTTGDVTIEDSFFGAAGPISIWTTGTLTIAGSRVTGGDLSLSANFLNISSTDFFVQTVSSFSAAVGSARDTTFSTTVTGFRPGSQTTLFDVSAPAWTVEPSAIVTVFHALRLRIIDVNSNPIASVGYEILHLPDNVGAGAGTLNGELLKDLEAGVYTGGVFTFNGNYRFTVSVAGQVPAVRYVVMDAAQTVIVSYPDEIVVPDRLYITAQVNPGEIQSGGANLTISGTVTVSYPLRFERIAPRTPAQISIQSASANFTNSTETLGSAFVWTGLVNATPGTHKISVTATYKTISTTTDVTVIVLIPPPHAIKIVLFENRFEKYVGVDFVISGVASFVGLYDEEKPAAGVTITVIFTVPYLQELYTTRTDENGFFNITIPARRTASTLILAVYATAELVDAEGKPITDDAGNPRILVSEQVALTLVVTPVGAVAPAGPLSALTLVLILGTIAAAGGVFAWFILSARRERVNYVECGSCGKPVHEGQKRCPSCGVEFEEDIAKCSNCASWIPANATRCPKCNTEFKPVGEGLEAVGGKEADAAAAEAQPVRAEVTTTAAPAAAKPGAAPVAVKKKVLKTAAPAEGAPAEKKDEFVNPWEQPKAEEQPPAEPTPPEPKMPEEKKEKKEKDLFDDL